MSVGGGSTVAETNTLASRVIFINSANATSTFNNSNSNFEFTMDEPVVVPPHHSILMSLMSAEIPFSFYRFNERNNTLQWEQTNAGTSATYNLGIPFGPGSATNPTNFELEELGNYTPQELADQIDNSNGQGQGINPIPELDITYSDVSQKFSFRSKAKAGAAPNNRVTLLLSSGNLVDVNDMVEELGYTEKELDLLGDPWFEYDNTLTNRYRSGFSKVVGGGVVETINTLVTNNDYYTRAPGVVDFDNQIRTLFLRTNLTTTSVMDSFIGGGFSNILARVPINADPGGTIAIVPSNGDVHKLLLKIKAFTSVHLRLTNHRNENINLNGLNFDVALKLDFIENQTLVMPDNIRQILEASKKEESVLEDIDEEEKTKKKKTKKNKK